MRPLTISGDPFAFKPEKAKAVIKTEFDTGIPFISGNIIIQYQMLPQFYLAMTLLVRFIFERPFSMRIIFDFFWVWFYLRFFMRSKSQSGSYEIGDLSNDF